MLQSNDRPLAVVTGASSGIGYELAREFAAHGYDLVIVAEDKGIVEAQQVFENLGSTVKSFCIDLASYDGAQKFYDEVKALGRAVDCLALNAGVGVNGDFVRETDLKEEINMINLNVQSTVHLSKLFLKDMVERDEGRVLYTSSIASQAPGPYYCVYAATKAFIEHFAQGLRYELKDTGSKVTVTTLLPNATETNFFRRAHMENTKVGQSKKDDPKDVARDGFSALMNGEDHVFAGSAKNVLQGFMSKFMPDQITAAQQAELARPLDHEKHS